MKLRINCNISYTPFTCIKAVLVFDVVWQAVFCYPMDSTPPVDLLPINTAQGLLIFLEEMIFFHKRVRQQYFMTFS
jgi:hypothetical protein